MQQTPPVLRPHAGSELIRFDRLKGSRQVVCSSFGGGPNTQVWLAKWPHSKIHEFSGAFGWLLSALLMWIQSFRFLKCLTVIPTVNISQHFHSYCFFGLGTAVCWVAGSWDKCPFDVNYRHQILAVAICNRWALGFPTKTTCGVWLLINLLCVSFAVLLVVRCLCCLVVLFVLQHMCFAYRFPQAVHLC